MGDNKFENLYESFVGQIDYCNLIESYGEDFATLFLKCNIDVLYDFITRNISDKSILLDDYLETLNVRYLLRSCRNVKEYK